MNPQAKNPKKIFSKIFVTHKWSGKSVSGAGSDSETTQTLRPALQQFLKDWSVFSILDIGCGDSNWITTLDLKGIEYIGIDTVPKLIKQNKIKYPQHKFYFIDASQPNILLPKTDLVICRDCLVHLNYSQIRNVIRNLAASGPRNCFLTTFVNHHENKSIVTGEWFPINMRLPPFNFGEPLWTINEECKQLRGAYADKSLCLWSIK